MSSDNLPPPKGLHAFQTDFAPYLRQPAAAMPLSVPERQANLYQNLLFNNVCGFVDRCFPVAKSLSKPESWRQLCRQFFAEWSCKTPYFKQIPLEFVSYVQQSGPRERFAGWFGELLHYEWVELAVQSSALTANCKAVRVAADTLLTCNATVHNLQYQWPVHRIGPGNLAQAAETTNLLVYRDQELAVSFVEVNAVTAALVALFQQRPRSLQDATAEIQQQLGHGRLDQLLAFAQPLVQGLVDSNALGAPVIEAAETAAPEESEARPQ